MKTIHCAVVLAAVGKAASFGFVNTCPRHLRNGLQNDSVVGGRTSRLMMNNKPNLDREEEIRNKIRELKKQGKIKPENEQLDNLRKARSEMKLGTSAIDDYADKLGAKLGKKSRALGMNLPTVSSKIVSGITDVKETRKPKLGTLDEDDLIDLDEDDDEEIMTADELQLQIEIESEIAKEAIDTLRRNVNDKEEEEMSEEDLMDAVNRALLETNFKTTREKSQEELEETKSTPPAISAATASPVQPTIAAGSSPAKTTSGVGGSWSPPAETEEYKPSKSGTWGVFPRPKSISQAYGGGKRVGAGYTNVNSNSDEVGDLLRAFNERHGIEVQSENDNKDMIDEALAIAERALGRGIYGVGISALEKVTQYCSTKSEAGGNVFLNLAMLYEAEGKTDQALSLYRTLAKSPNERIKINADKLLYGLEAMRFMRDEAKLKDFSRKSYADTFIDATGFKDMSSKFDDVYNTAYLDLEKGQYYRILTENVVRSTREARQILLKAVASGEVERLKVVQALRSIGRHFDDALEEEKKQIEEKKQVVPVDFQGRPIVGALRNEGNPLANSKGLDNFVLSEASQTLENLQGEWRLQLMADKSGDGVDYFYNTTLISQKINTGDMVYFSTSQGLRGTQSGGIMFDGEDRILTREGAKAYTGGGGGDFFGMFGGNKSGRGVKMSNVPQQILSVDSVLLITRAIVEVSYLDNVKDYYSVWRKIEQGSMP